MIRSNGDAEDMRRDVMHESGENYLETILVIKEKKGSVRSIDCRGRFC